MILRSEFECAQENVNVADNTPKTMRKCRSSNKNEPCVAFKEVDVNAPSMKRGKPTGSQKKKEEPPTGTILAYVEHDKLLRFIHTSQMIHKCTAFSFLHQ